MFLISRCAFRKPLLSGTKETFLRNRSVWVERSGKNELHRPCRSARKNFGA